MVFIFHFLFWVPGPTFLCRVSGLTEPRVSVSGLGFTLTLLYQPIFTNRLCFLLCWLALSANISVRMFNAANWTLVPAILAFIHTIPFLICSNSKPSLKVLSLIHFLDCQHQYGCSMLEIEPWYSLYSHSYIRYSFKLEA